jgi:hypothetical protein
LTSKGSQNQRERIDPYPAKLIKFSCYDRLCLEEAQCIITAAFIQVVTQHDLMLLSLEILKMSDFVSYSITEKVKKQM